MEKWGPSEPWLKKGKVGFSRRMGGISGEMFIGETVDDVGGKGSENGTDGVRIPETTFSS